MRFSDKLPWRMLGFFCFHDIRNFLIPSLPVIGRHLMSWLYDTSRATKISWAKCKNRHLDKCRKSDSNTYHQGTHLKRINVIYSSCNCTWSITNNAPQIVKGILIWSRHQYQFECLYEITFCRLLLLLKRWRKETIQKIRPKMGA
jgi:hypothetical protein